VALLGNLTGSSQFFNPGNFYNGVARQSLRLDRDSSAYLTRTPSSASNRKTWTWSSWIKLGEVSEDRCIFSASTDASNRNALNLVEQHYFVFDYEVGGSRYLVSSQDAVYRDPSAWYHVVLAVDTTQSTNTNRVKIYVNGSQITLTTILNGYPPQNADMFINNNIGHAIGKQNWGTAYYDGYMTEVNFVDGNAYDASYFGETKNGVWIPIKYTGSYGTNGFRLQFLQTGTSANSSGIGADTSGQANHFAVNTLAASDVVLDSPENNFMTFNPLMRQSQGSDFPQTHEGNLQAQFTGSDQYKYIWSTFSIKPNTGKWYFEVEMQTNMGSTNDIAYIGLGTVGPNFTPTASNGTVGPTNFYIAWRGNTGVRTLYINDAGQSQTTVTVTNMTAGQIWQFAIDTDTGKVWLGLNNSYYAADGGTDGNPSAGTNESGTFSTNTNELSFFGQAQNYNITNVYYALNAGQDSSFHENKTAQGNTDANGIGDFYYAPPTGYKAICSANLPEPTIGPNSATQADDHFNTVLISTGTDSETAITGVGFQPDFTWGKSRNSAYSHQLYDSSRGATKYLESDDTATEATDANSLKSFDSDGITIGTGSTFSPYSNGNNVVFWNWKANGGTTSSNSDGSITSTVQANTTAGFSIVTYNGTGATATVGHGLGSVPKMLIFKNRDNDQNWRTYHVALGETKAVVLDGNGASQTYDFFNDTAPTSSVFSLSSHEDANRNGDKIVAYCFADIEGYSKFGSYTGNGNADGPFVHTGFRPAFLMIKNTTSSADWVILDTKRNTYNPVQNNLYPSSTATEGTGNLIDYVSNGFKCRFTYSTSNNDAKVYIYMAFAENPFKYANAR